MKGQAKSGFGAYGRGPPLPLPRWHLRWACSARRRCGGLVREIFHEVLAERDRRVEEERQARERAEQERLASIRRSTLTPRQKSDLINLIGYDQYMQLKYNDQPRDSNGRYRPR